MKQSKQPGPRRARRPRRPSGGRGRSLLQPLIFLLICAALVLGMSVFFRVAKIEVVGNSISVSYTHLTLPTICSV